MIISNPSAVPWVSAVGKQMLITRSVKHIYNVKHRNCTVCVGTHLESKAH